jgi:hypothetical protein
MQCAQLARRGYSENRATAINARRLVRIAAGRVAPNNRRPIQCAVIALDKRTVGDCTVARLATEVVDYAMVSGKRQPIHGAAVSSRAVVGTSADRCAVKVSVSSLDKLANWTISGPSAAIEMV